MGLDAIMGAVLIAMEVAIPVVLWWLLLPRPLALATIFVTTVSVPIVNSLVAWPPHERTLHNVIDTFSGYESTVMFLASWLVCLISALLTVIVTCWATRLIRRFRQSLP